MADREKQDIWPPDDEWVPFCLPLVEGRCIPERRMSLIGGQFVIEYRYPRPSDETDKIMIRGADMSALERLLNLESHSLEVFRAGENIAVMYLGGEVSDGYVRMGEFGKGTTVEEACEDYLKKISGKTLVFGFGENRKEIRVL